MDDEPWVKIATNLVKIGNSFSVRIPMNIVKKIKAGEGDMLVIKVKRLKLEISPEIIDKFYQSAKKCKKLDSFSDDKIYLLSRLSFNEGKFILNKVKNKLNGDSEKQSDMASKMTTALKENEENIKNQFGEKIYTDFLLFRECVNKRLGEENLKKPPRQVH